MNTAVEDFVVVSELTVDAIPTSFEDEETLETITEAVLSDRVATAIQIGRAHV